MSNIVRLADSESPFERYRRLNPVDCAELQRNVAVIGGCTNGAAGIIMQEIINAVYRDAQRRMKAIEESLNV